MGPLYLETGALDAISGAGLLQAKDSKQFPKHEAPDNAALQQILSISRV